MIIPLDDRTNATYSCWMSVPLHRYLWRSLFITHLSGCNELTSRRCLEKRKVEWAISGVGVRCERGRWPTSSWRWCRWRRARGWRKLGPSSPCRTTRVGAPPPWTGRGSWSRRRRMRSLRPRPKSGWRFLLPETSFCEKFWNYKENLIAVSMSKLPNYV